ncbi:MAG TPA: amidohydrolase family protein [Parvularculaceae bacterium]|nr:amidohydrolase family protein [Parvularculaceae bacterium]
MAIETSFRLLAFASALALAAGAASADDLAVAPKSAKTWSIVSASGQFGEEKMWTDSDGVHWARMHMLLRGLTFDVDEATTVNENKVPTKFVIRGATPLGNAGETFSIDNGKASWKSPVDSGEADWRDNLIYVPYGGPNDTQVQLLNALLADSDRKLDALPGGAVSLADLTTHVVTVGGQTKKLKAVLIEGESFSPFPMWIDEANHFFASVGGLSWMPKGWESVRQELNDAQDAALAARAPAERARLMKDPGAPVLFKNAMIYASRAKGFERGMSVLVKGGKIAAVGKAFRLKAPKNAIVIDATGKTLVPGLWDMHRHYGDDGEGALDLAQGVTSARDCGNDRDEIIARKRRIDDGELLGPKIYPLLGIDGDGPLAQWNFVRIHSIDEGVAAIDSGHDDGFYGIKLYGSIKPEWVAPLAAEAHKLGMQVWGHIPAGMRPSEAIAAGYDGVNHVSYVLMEAMPDEVVNTDNGPNRFFGPARYAKDVDLTKPPMAALLRTLKLKHIVIDPTLTLFESFFVPDAGEVAPAYKSWMGVMPPQVERGFKAGGFVAPEAYHVTRDDMRASFNKFVDTVRTMHEKGIQIVAGTDGYASDLIREIELYTTVGMTNAEALSTATDGAAKQLGQSGHVGAIAPGMDADLVLVDGDVSKSIGDLRHVEKVMMGGMLMDGAELRATVGITGMPH